jgi:uncharacterized protein YvpB
MRRLLLCVLVLTISAATFDLGAAADVPASAMVQGVSGQAQTYSLSCESRSAVDWAAYWGVSLNESEFLAKLPRSDNPDAGFVGDPNQAWGNIPPASYGVHARPVAALLRKAGMQAKARQNMSWKDLRKEIAAGRPVIVWVIGEMLSGMPIQYTASDGHTTTVAHFEHTMIVVGYEPEAVHVVDAYTGQHKTYWRESFMSSWRVLGRMAVTGGLNIEPAPTATQPAPAAYEIKTILRLPLVYRQTGGQQAQPAATAAPEPKQKPAQSKTYTVQPGDYLSALATQFGMDWRSLADLNGIGYPYIIYAGQVLKLR